MAFTKVLIANRGEIAVRIARTLKDLEIASVVVYHAMDADSPAARAADEAVEIIGDTPVAAYLDAEEILRVAKSTGAEAIHPGYGFLSENAGFAEAVEAAGLTFIGPRSETLTLMGDKIQSRKFVADNGFPVSASVELEDDMEAFLKAADGLGYPLMVKASAGGGGKGMKIVHDKSGLEEAAKTAASEAERYFGSGALFAERFIEQPRHIEVQVLGDGLGGAVHLFERECSVQRRFQKVIEETPAPNLPAEVCAKICEAAVGIAKASNYLNAGTVEFILAPDGSFHFLEMNTRLQVEHPVTEMVTGIDLVAEQLKLAAGEGLSLAQSDIKRLGHAIECRLYAEDAVGGFLPATGTILDFHVPQGPGVRLDSGVASGSVVTSAFDPMLAKLIVSAANREQAIARCRAVLRETAVLGVTTNSAWLERVLGHEGFAGGAYDTGLLDRIAEDLAGEDLTEEQERAILAAAALLDRMTGRGGPEAPEPHASIGYWRN
jgi:acetyl-CoA/propionyl-CoA carboxylase biotin carboxyl carrier protein